MLAAGGGGMSGHGEHEPWGDDRRTRQLVRVITGLSVVIVLGAVVGMVYVVLG